MFKKVHAADIMQRDLSSPYDLADRPIGPWSASLQCMMHMYGSYLLRSSTYNRTVHYGTSTEHNGRETQQHTVVYLEIV
jgi:hypothetical protein